MIRLCVSAATLALAALATHAEPVTLRLAVGSVGQEQEMFRLGAEAWAAKTGNKVVLIGSPASPSDRLALFQQQLAAGGADTDVYLLDVVWPGLLAAFFEDLAPHLTDDERIAFFPAMMEGNTIDGKLVALPAFTDAALLFYRTDLLEKYGYATPPETWDEMAAMAAKIQEGERADNASFWGLVFQGAPYEGLTCNALEWVASNGGGTILDAKGEPSVNNAGAAAILQQVASWVGNIAPPGVTSYQEEQARGVFQAGNAAFMRNWPYAIATGNSADSPIAGKFAVARLPRGSAEGARHAACLGGWQLAVAKTSKHPAEAIELVRYLTGAEEQKRRALEAAFLPTRPALYEDAEIVAARPELQQLLPMLETAIPRPAHLAGPNYNRVSSAFYQAVHQVLSGQAKATDALATLDSQLKRATRRR